jgi:putative oxidoreductase
MNSLVKKFFATDTQSWALLIARVTLGVVILPHGMQKALGSFGGYGFEATLGYFTSSGMPLVLGVLVILAEFVGSLAIILGLGTRFMAFSLFITMFGAMIIGGHVQHGFFMNWFGTQGGEGLQFFILVLALGLIGMISGGGKFSADGYISEKLK